MYSNDLVTGGEWRFETIVRYIITYKNNKTKNYCADLVYACVEVLSIIIFARHALI